MNRNKIIGLSLLTIVLVGLVLLVPTSQNPTLTYVRGDGPNGSRIEEIRILQDRTGTYETIQTFTIGAGDNSTIFKLYPLNDTQIWVKVLLEKYLYAGDTASNNTRVYITISGLQTLVNNVTMIDINATESGSWDHCWKVYQWSDPNHPISGGEYFFSLRYHAFYDPDDL